MLSLPASSLWHLARGFLPAEVAAKYDVAAEDSALAETVADGVRDDGGGHRELHRGGVHDAHDVARSRGLEDAEEGAVEAVLGVQLNHLLVVVRALEELDARVERAAVSLEEDLDRVDERVERVGAERAALNGRGGSEAIGRRVLDVVGVHVSGERELELADVADGDRVRAAGGLNHGAKGAELAVLDVDAHLARGVVRSVPELDVRVERAALSGKDDLHLLDERGAVRPSAEGAALDEDGRVGGHLAAAAGREGAAEDLLALASRRGGALVEVVRAHEDTALGEGAGRGEGLGRDREAERQDNGGEANHLVVVVVRVVGVEGGGVEGREERRRMRVAG
eukprot:CAMPEP_0119542252 /NCGR_PEP_ID=MMETSP1344-20130328/53465_1 /TAXON_ID=236787 /ORGANISM="Florenciella parvula, Strain CCMP2471" /LENGTH=338 /DNA_ID=CAMNT_0007586433 /DNA_START=151 /DNA_END=1163 /DNA_ORIENTATION=-